MSERESKCVLACVRVTPGSLKGVIPAVSCSTSPYPLGYSMSGYCTTVSQNGEESPHPEG